MNHDHSSEVVTLVRLALILLVVFEFLYPAYPSSFLGRLGFHILGEVWSFKIFVFSNLQAELAVIYAILEILCTQYVLCALLCLI